MAKVFSNYQCDSFVAENFSSRTDFGSCDTFVVLPPNTANGCIIFGKNSDRPENEVQEIVYQAAEDHPKGSKLLCTYIEIEQCVHTHAVILSKPSWMWGAEMGANEHGVCIGNEAVWTKLGGPDDDEEKLLGMDMVRIGLERGATAVEALEVITGLLEKHGQGGLCSDSLPGFTYHNSFLIVDRSEAWVLETAGQHWAAEHISSGYRNISNLLSIGTKIDRSSNGLKDLAKQRGWWDGSSDFSFTGAFGLHNDSGSERLAAGKKLLCDLSKSGGFNESLMFSVLRDEKSGISRGVTYGTPTAGSQVSVLVPKGNQRPSCHWFTGTPDPTRSAFKPFIFTPRPNVSLHVKSPHIDPKEDPAKIIPRFQKPVDRRHRLYELHEKVLRGENEELVKTLRKMEEKCVREVDAFLESYSDDRLSEVHDLFKDCVESELKFYK